MDFSEDAEKTLKLQSSLNAFIDKVDNLRNEDEPAGDGFDREFRIIRDLGQKMREENTYPAEEGKKSCNIKKNRYKDILPFDETRVVLDEIDGEEGSDYINANFIRDQNGFLAYIASQGPVTNTINDFWRMIWENEVKVVAMACRLVEMGKRKCEQYWPSEVNQPEEYGKIRVTMISEEDLAEHCTKRELKAEKDGATLFVTQFHYTGWPDHDIPHDFDVILEMMAQMRQIKSKDPKKASMVIHCSAGCGRTGTICAIDYAWDVLKSGNMNDNFSLHAIIKQMRQQRQSMIQAPEQYMMAHVTVQTLFNKHLELMEDHTYGNFNFNNEESDSGHDEHVDSVYAVPDNLSVTSGSSSHTYPRKNSILQQDIADTLHHQKGTPPHHGGPLLDIPVPQCGTPLVATHVETTVPHHGSTHVVTAVPQHGAQLATPMVAETPTSVQEQVKKLSIRNKTAVFKVNSIENIPNKPELKAKTSLVSSNESEKRVISAVKPAPLSPKPSIDTSFPALNKASSAQTSPVNNNATLKSQSPSETKQRPKMQRMQSENKSGIFVTTLSVGKANVSDGKTAAKKTMSSPSKPQNEGRDGGITQTKSLPFNVTPQSSIPPLTPTQSSVSTYALAGNSQFYPPEPQADDTSYSALANYSSVHSNSKKPPPYINVSQSQLFTNSSAAPPPGVTALNNQQPHGFTYSYANPTETQSGGLYASVNKPTASSKQNGKVTDDTYETVRVGQQGDQAPAIPDRKYMDEEPNNQNTDKTGPGEMNSKKNQLTSVLKNLFTSTGNKTMNSDNMVPSEIPGFKVKLGKKPKGPKQQPGSWKRK